MSLQEYRANERKRQNMRKRKRFKEVTREEKDYWFKKLKDTPLNTGVIMWKENNSTRLSRITYTQHYT